MSASWEGRRPLADDAIRLGLRCSWAISTTVLFPGAISTQCDRELSGWITPRPPFSRRPRCAPAVNPGAGIRGNLQFHASGRLTHPEAPGHTDSALDTTPMQPDHGLLQARRTVAKYCRTHERILVALLLSSARTAFNRADSPTSMRPSSDSTMQSNGCSFESTNTEKTIVGFSCCC